MGTKICMNVSCGTSNTQEWRNGWPLRSGGFAHLCFKCGPAYEKSVFCDTFHLGETGWRECSSCHKSLHCGCVASTSLYECLDYGGVGCISCSNSSQPRVVPRNDVLNGFGGLTLSNAGDRNINSVEYRAVGDTVDEGKFLQLCGTVDEGKLLQLCKSMEANESTILPQSPTGEESAFLESNLLHRPQRDDKSESLGQTKGQEAIHQIGEVSPGFFSPTQSSNGSLTFAAQPDNGRTMSEVNHTSALSSHPSLSMSLGAPSTTPSFMQPFSGAHMDIRDQSKTPSSSQQVPKSRPIFPRPLQSPLLPVSSETNRSVRIARSPAEGRGKNQLLPRYWPRITDQELQKLAGALNATIVPLFEKVLSASDAGRIGRLVLPKACAEAYFPHISHSEGLPIRIQDVKGNEWTFQFRFWPNNNSRMYVLEGVTPCIQSMQLQAGDTVTFSRLDPGNKLVIGFRKASQSVNMQGPVFQNGTPGETSFSSDHLATGSGDSSLFRMNNGSKDPSLTSPSDHHLAVWDTHMQNHENNGHRTSEDLLHPVSNSEKKRARNIGPKSKRFLMHSEDVMELRLTWEDAQDLLRPPPSVIPSIVTIEDFEFEEYDEPPVYGKRSIFTAGPSNKGQEQWAQCDDCSKWRKLPGEVLLPPRWRCSENSWDSSRSSCTAPEEISSKQLDNLLNSYVSHKGLRKRRKIIEKKEAEEQERSGLDALASAAILGDNVHESGEQSIGATTRHPRHRPGCTCIVCIQPPSGKGKHKPSCRCNVCLTVKRRFTTMMQRKLEKRQLEREAENYQRNNGNYKDDSETNGITMGDSALNRNNNADISQMNNNNHKDESEMNGTMLGDVATLRDHSSENGASSSQSRSQADATEISNAGQIDLNFDLSSLFRNPPLQDLLNLAKAAPDGQASEKYTNENPLKAMIDEDQAGLASCTLVQANGDNETQLPNEAHRS